MGNPTQTPAHPQQSRSAAAAAARMAGTSLKDRKRSLWAATATAALPEAIKLCEDTNEAILEAATLADNMLVQYAKRFGGGNHG